jgi:uncharacterized Zn finger protein (UPF0148 family)
MQEELKRCCEVVPTLFKVGPRKKVFCPVCGRRVVRKTLDDLIYAWNHRPEPVEAERKE